MEQYTYIYIYLQRAEGERTFDRVGAVYNDVICVYEIEVETYICIYTAEDARNGEI